MDETWSENIFPQLEKKLGELVNEISSNGIIPASMSPDYRGPYLPAY